MYSRSDTRSAGGTQRGDPQPGAENLVEMFLLDAVVLRATRELQAERVAIELETAFGVADHNRGVVYPEKESIGRLLPARRLCPAETR